MPSMIEALLGQDVVRKDEKRLTVVLRPLPVRPRDMFDLIIAQGREPSLEAVLRSVELKTADPRALTFVTLGRWPTPEELAGLPMPYKPRQHLRQLLQTTEFRRSFARRLLDAFPERRRLLFVRIPRSGGAHIMTNAATRHPIMPQHIAEPIRMSVPDLLTAIGDALYRFNSATSVMMSAPKLKPFIQPLQPAADAADLLHWIAVPPPARAGDALFAIIREPRSLLLSQVNATLAGLRANPSPDTPSMADTGAWKDIGRRVLRDLNLKNPICSALGDGSAETALAACRISGIELVGISRQTDWARTALSNEITQPLNTSVPILTSDDLGVEDRAHLDSLLAEDLAFHDRFASRFDPTQVTAISGANL